MKAKFIYESVESYLEPKGEDEIVNSLSKLSKEELGKKLIDAVYDGLTDVVQYLIKAGVDINFKDLDGYAPLHRACIYGYDYDQIVKILLNAGADINIKTRFGHTALHLAAYYGHEQIVKLLKSYGAKE